MSKNSLETLCSRRADPLCVCGFLAEFLHPSFHIHQSLAVSAPYAVNTVTGGRSTGLAPPNTEGQGLNEPAFLILKPVNDVEALKHHTPVSRNNNAKGQTG